MPVPPTNTTVPYVSGCQSDSGCGADCDTCGDSCDCGTDCATGAVKLRRSYLVTPHGDFSFSFSNLFSQSGTAANPNFGVGTNFLPEQWAFATNSASDEWGFIWGPARAKWFDVTTLPYLAKYGSRYILTIDTGGNFRLNDPDTGTVYIFDATTGLLLSTTTSGGQSTVNTIVGGVITETARSFTYTQGGVTRTTTEVRRYDYYPGGSGASSGLLQFVTLLRPDDTASAIRRIALTYYGTGDSGGNAGDLKTVAEQLLAGTTWQTISTEYFRYYTQDYDHTPSTQPGYVHGLKFVVGPEAFARLSRTADPFTAPDVIVARFADVYYEYTQASDGDFAGVRRVTKAITEAGTLEFDFAYETAAGWSPGFNSWFLKITADRPDGSRKFTFSNFLGQIMLTDFWATPGVMSDGRLISYVQYDPTCACPTYCYTPAAINMSASLIYDQSVAGLAVSLNTATGLVNVSVYYTSGFAACLLQTRQVQQGSTGVSLTSIRSYTYSAQTIGTSPTQTTIVLPASLTEYQSDAGGGSSPAVTSYAYTFITGTVQVQKKTTTLAQIPSSQNGQGDNPSTDPLYVINEFFDIQGRQTARTDPYDSNNVPSFIPSVASSYDEPTGALIQQVVNPYTGTPPTLSEYNLITDFQVDDLGRTVQSLGPTFNVNGQWVRTAAWTAYLDASQQVYSASGFATGSNNGPLNNFTLVNPVSISIMDLAGRVTDVISAVRAATNGALSAADQFPQSSWVRWTNNAFNNAGKLTGTRVYKLIPADNDGLPDINFDEPTFGYDVMGRQNMQRSPGGTITRTVFDICDDPIEVYVGTEDEEATDDEPDGFGNPGNNMVLVQINLYDNGDPVGGNGLLTSIIREIVGSEFPNQQTNFAYDFRGRPTISTAFIIPISLSVVTVSMYDNLDRVIQQDQYNTTIASANRIRESQAFFDNLGRIYQTIIYAVPITGGSAGTPSMPQVSNTWFNANNQPVKEMPAGAKTYGKTQYDQVRRISGSFIGYSDGSDNPWSIGTADHLLEQTLLAYDPDSNAIQATFFQRNQGATSATGVLLTSNSRVMYMGAWYDGIGRSIASANVGTTSFDRSVVTSVPAPSADVLVNSIAINDRGEVFQATDPTGMVSQLTFDDAGRWIEWIQNLQAGAASGSDTNVTVRQSYSPDGNVASLTAVNPATGDQLTRYLYGTSLTDGNDIARSDLLAAVVYPAATDSTDQVIFKYNVQSQIKQFSDQNGNVRQFVLDGLGRAIRDIVTVLGAGVDASVQRIDTSYEIRGMVNQVTSFSDQFGLSPANQVVLTYNAFEQLSADAQNHTGAGGTPPEVDYIYASGSANTTRLLSITYPNGRILGYDYATGEDDSLSRVTDLTISGESTAAVAYQYFGLSSFANLTYPQPTVVSTLANGGSYLGFDKFNRIIALPWTKTLAGDLAQLNYGYNQASNRLYRRDVKAGTSNEQDQIYAYDGLQRLQTFRQGALTVSGVNYRLTNLVFSQAWNLDPTGNWSEFSQSDQSDSANGLDQQRLSNAFNEITNITTTVGEQWITPTYDRNGNTTTIPKQTDLTAGYAAIYDAWNRLACVTTFGPQDVVTYQHDGLNRRIVELRYDPPGTLLETRDLYYSAWWQVLEERVNGSSSAQSQYVWGLRYVDDCILRDRDTGGFFIERLYALQDANWNVVALCDVTGSVQERYAYTPYGVVTIFDPSWTVRSSSSLTCQYLFQGGRFETPTGLYYFRNREYSPVLGCWIQVDPIGYSAEDLNLRRYVGNNGINVTDPNGLQELLPVPSESLPRKPKPNRYQSASLFDFERPEVLPTPRQVEPLPRKPKPNRFQSASLFDFERPEVLPMPRQVEPLPEKP